ncbi:hypothetical protein B0H12DRAFT_1068665 [Mycena haematopus]|nr:hypothetical protein B0H12DRAFT_1068665 [Mycena haematopus]
MRTSTGGSPQRKPARRGVLSDSSNKSQPSSKKSKAGRRTTWSLRSMPEFVGSSAGNPWVLNDQGELVLGGPATPPASSAPAPPQKPREVYPGIILGPPSSIIPQSPSAESSRILRTLRAVDKEAELGRQRVHTLLRAARRELAAINRASRQIDENERSGTSAAAVPPVRASRLVRVIGPRTCSAATTLVRRTAAEKARQTAE